MKQTFIGILIIAFITTSIFWGCSKNKNDIELKDPNSLSEDKAFIDLTNETLDYIFYISKLTKQKSLVLNDLQKSISDLQNKNLSFEYQMIVLDSLFKGDISTRLLAHMKVFKTNWNSIKISYKPISSEIMDKECSEILSTKILVPISKNSLLTMKAPSTGSGCTWRYYLCAGAATSGAILCHASCDATALVASAGLGIPACVILCGVVQVAGLTQCYDSFCN